MHKIVAGIAALAALSLSTASAVAQGKPGIEKLYVLNCGEGIAGDVSRWSPGVDVGVAKDFVDNCYLIRHAQGWLLWDTGVSDAVAAMPDGQPPGQAGATHWKRKSTLIADLAALGVKPADVKFVAVSHSHGDHAGNVGRFPQSTLLVQRAEYDWPGPQGAARFPAANPVTKLEGDHDVFGDGSAVILATPGHTPGHQSLLVRLPKTGALILSGDAVHFQSNWEHRRVPGFNSDKDQTVASMQRIADLMAKEKAQLWINHDKPQRDGLKMAPAFYE